MVAKWKQKPAAMKYFGQTFHHTWCEIKTQNWTSTVNICTCLLYRSAKMHLLNMIILSWPIPWEYTSIQIHNVWFYTFSVVLLIVVESWLRWPVPFVYITCDTFKIVVYIVTLSWGPLVQDVQLSYDTSRYYNWSNKICFSAKEI